MMNGWLLCTGVHPHDAKTWTDDCYEVIKELASNPECVAVGMYSPKYTVYIYLSTSVFSCRGVWFGFQSQLLTSGCANGSI